MDASLLAFLLSAGAAVAVAVLIYRRRELRVPGRGVLALVRATVLVLALLLVWNPQLPGNLAPTTTADSWVLLDRSMSMGADAEAWRQVLGRVRGSINPGMRVATFGSGVRIVPADSLIDLAADDPSTNLATAIERAAEAGARSIRVVSDLRVRDGTAAAAVLRRTPADIAFDQVGGRVRNVGLAEVMAPRDVESDQSVTLALVVQGEGGEAGDSVTVDVREGERLVASQRLPMPGDGRQVRTQVTVPAPAVEGQVRYRIAAHLPGDTFAADDERIVRVDVGPEIRGAVLLSLHPDWEPRFLLPVLQQVTGLTTRGYLSLRNGRYLVAGGGTDERGTVPEDEVRRAVTGAELLVLHGVGRGAPEWIVQAAESAGRLLVLAHDPGGAALAGVEVGPPLPGEWYVAGELPASPLAADLSGTDFAGLPPLGGILPLATPSLMPLTLLRDGRGDPESALALNEVGGRRRVAMLAVGFWRWGFREGTARDAYRRLWAAVSGWLLATESVALGPGVRPSDRVLPRGEPINWRAGGLAGDTVRLQISRDGADVLDTVFAVPPSESFTTNPLAPGEYTFLARAGEGSEPDGSGEFDVEEFTDELLLPPVPLEGISAADQTPAAGTPTPAGRPLRTYPALYLILLALLCLEWIARRRLGLR